MKPNDNKSAVKKRAAVYIRESTEEQDKGFSPENQRKRIQEYANDHGMVQVNFYKDLISGRSAAKRTDFQRMISDALAGQFDVILIFHTSRFARNVKDAREYKELLRKRHGIDVVSVTQDFGDWNDPNSFLNEGINELFDEHQSRNISFWVQEGLMEKRMVGKKIGNPPFGYHKEQIGYDEEKGRPIYKAIWLIESTQAQWVKEAFTLYAQGGYSYADIANKLNKAGIKTKYDNQFSYSSIKDMLKNRAYLGYTTSPRKGLPEIPNTHEPIIAEELFNQVQAMIGQRRNRTGRPTAQHRTYLLQGLVYCYPCREREDGDTKRWHNTAAPNMYCQTKRFLKHDDARYICKFRKEDRSCKQSTVTSKIIDDQAKELMEAFSIPSDVIELAAQKFKQKLIDRKTQKPTTIVDRTSLLREEKAQLEKQRQKLNLQFLKYEAITENEYALQLEIIRERVATIDTQLIELGSKTDLKKPTISDSQKMETMVAYLQDFPAFFADMEPVQQRNWLLMSIERLWVDKKQLVAIQPKESFVPLFESMQDIAKGWKDGDQFPLATHEKKGCPSGAFFLFIC